jgi:hypothetical protein
MKDPAIVGGCLCCGATLIVVNLFGLEGPAASTGIVASFLFGAIAIKAAQRGMLGASSGFWHSVPGRWLIGRMAGLAVLLLLLLPVRFAVDRFFTWEILDTYAREGADAALKVAECYAGLGWPISVLIAWRLRTRAKVIIGKGSRPFRRWYRSFRMGRGGSAGFASIFEEWANRWEPGKIFLGHSLHDRHWPVGVRDDRMQMTIAGNGGGKGETAIIPNLLTYRGSVFVNDTKGQDAAVTARARREMGQDVFLLAAFAKETAHLNPLAGLDPEAPDYVERIKGIVDAIVIAGEGKDRVWSDWARIVLEGLVDLEVRYHEESGHAE